MLNKDKKKNLAAMIVAKIKPKKEEKMDESMDMESSDNDMALNEACSDMISAFNESNPEKLKQALLDFLSLNEEL